ncbi:outer membrane translocation and assembly module TamA [Pedobacter africanus]|uniref:Outer membrane translocation and assembly module TamA n=1 Tax=Pedobacter africanus TaxID=151894 RepID=A0ACC6KWW2_9SPHI|nr:BamA/TamA family outer membrane protein [Pedobacter africanus]MDR6783868.1 outer membrane translocation and assembly module TamA [Pedobacter africanus]
MKKLSICTLFVLITANALAQKKLIERYLSNKTDSSRRPSFMPVPIFRYSQEIGVEFGAGLLYSTYLDRKDLSNRSSNFSGVVSASTKGQYNVTLKSDIWTKKNTHHYISEVRFKRMPFNFYGIGNETDAANEDRLVQGFVKVVLEAEKRFWPSMYTGFSAGFENYHFTDKEIGGIFTTDPTIIHKIGGSVFYAGVSQTYDTRNSNNYTTKGMMAKVSYQYAPDFWGKENFTGSLIKANVRSFWSLSPKFVIGVNGLFHSIQGKNVPFYLLPQMGNDEMMRGYYTGRYRDRNLLAAQAELRYRYNNRFGAAIFGGAGQVFENGGLGIKNFKPSYGAGGRYFFDPEKGLSVRVDYGIGEKRTNEKRQTGFYISLAEAF